ncbi:MAG: Tim44-like domain-containing protein [Burkholderiales bacterium]|nr:Tim44-like domain-containing protein [Burkholderiales bacterium]
MKNFLMALIAACGLSLIAVDVEAKRLGGGRNLGMQRNVQQAPPKAPAQQQQQQQAQQPGTPAPQPAAAAGNKWMGPLAGLALGAGLMALFMNNGIAGALAGLLLLAAIAGVAVMAFRMLRGKAATAPMQYAGNGPQPLGNATGSGAAVHSLAAATASASRWPADFNAQEFLRHARLNFVRLQEAHDARDATALADFLTPDLLEDIRAHWQSDAEATGTTDVVTLESEVLDVVTEGLLHVVSVRFSGLIREGSDEPQSFAEIWHLEKPLRGNAGWMVSGIQQA